MTTFMMFIAEGPGKKLQESLGEEIGSLFLLAVVAMSLFFFWKRQFTEFIGFALFAMLVGVFIFSPDLVRSLGSDAFSWLFEAYLK